MRNPNSFEEAIQAARAAMSKRRPRSSRRYREHLARCHKLGFAYGQRSESYVIDLVRSDPEYWAFMAGYQWARDVVAFAEAVHSPPWPGTGPVEEQQ